MTPKTQRQLLVLGGLLAVFVVITFMRGQSSESSTAAPAPPSRQQPPSGTASSGAPATAAATSEVADVQLELLKAPHDDVGGPQRNLFRFYERPAPPPAPRPVSRPTPAAPPVPQGPPPPPPITLRLIGLLNAPSQAGRVAVLSDGRGNVFNGREGDIIEGRYRLLRIGADSAELAYTDGRGRQVIRLAGQ